MLYATAINITMILLTNDLGGPYDIILPLWWHSMKALNILHNNIHIEIRCVTTYMMSQWYMWLMTLQSFASCSNMSHERPPQASYNDQWYHSPHARVTIVWSLWRHQQLIVTSSADREASEWGASPCVKIVVFIPIWQEYIFSSVRSNKSKKEQ